MPYNGSDPPQVWREAGAWWAGEPPLEVNRIVLPSGKTKDVLTRLPIPWGEKTVIKDTIETHHEEIDLRPRKVRDVKVSEACGLVKHYPPVPKPRQLSTYVPLQLMSGYSFGESTLYAEELPRRCAALGISAAALTDRFSLAGVVEFAREAQKNGVKPLLGTTVNFYGLGECVIIAKTKRGFSNLSQLITRCHLDHPRGEPNCTQQMFERFCRDWIILTGGDRGVLAHYLLRREYIEAQQWLDFLIRCAGKQNVYLQVERTYLPWEIDLTRRIIELSENWGLSIVAAHPCKMQTPAQFPGQDILACANTLCMVDELIGRKPNPYGLTHPAREWNAERYLWSNESFVEHYKDHPEWISATHHVAHQCDDDVLPSRTHLPQTSEDDALALRQAVKEGAAQRYSQTSLALERRLEYELQRIIKLNFSTHFMIAKQFCDYAQEQSIQFSARGSVVDSVVAYCLGFSRIDAFQHNLHFDRFLPDDGSKRPDIDIDFEAKRRDDIRAFIEKTYGRERTAGVAAYGAFCVRGIVREVGKALGIPPSLIQFLAKRIHGGVAPDSLERALLKKPELVKSGIPIERFRWVFRLAEMLQDVPRNLRAHSSGVVVSSAPICETVPLQSGASSIEDEHVQLIQWDKRSSKYYFDKFDILCLRGQDVLSGTQTFSKQDVTSISLEDPYTFEAMRSGDLIGIPQSASPAMRQAHMRLRTENLEDASLVQAGIRPGVGGAVKLNELIARKRGMKPYTFEHPELENILGQTYGLVVFQEQVDQLLQTFCNYTSGEAEDIRDQIHKKRREDFAYLIEKEIKDRIMTEGYSESVAAHVFDLVAMFKGYGFAQGHALAFADIPIRSIYCQQNMPAEYFAALFNAQPAGYYGPATLANEARSRGVKLLRPDINISRALFVPEEMIDEQMPHLSIPNGAVRIGLSQIKGLSKACIHSIILGQPFSCLQDAFLRINANMEEWRRLILSGSVDSFGIPRKQLLWLRPEFLRSKNNKNELPELAVPLTAQEDDFNPIEKSIYERAILSLDIEQHLMAHERERVSRGGAIPTSEAKQLKNGVKAIVVGNPIRLRFPPTPSGKRVVFFDLEDEYGLLNVTCFDRTYQRDGHAIVCSNYVTIIGRVQERGEHKAFLADRVFQYIPKRTLEHVRAADLPLKKSDFLVG